MEAVGPGEAPTGVSWPAAAPRPRRSAWPRRRRRELIALFAIAAHADETRSLQQRSRPVAENLPEGSYGDGTARPSPPARPASPPGCAPSNRPTAPRPSTAPRPGRPSPPGHSVLQSVRPTGRSSLSKRPANPYRTVADSAAARYLHRGGWAVSERYPRSGDSEFTPAGKPFEPALTGHYGPPDSRARLARFPWSAPSRIRETGRSIRIGSVQPGNGGPREVKGIYGNRRSLAWSRAKEPRPIG